MMGCVIHRLSRKNPPGFFQSTSNRLSGVIFSFDVAALMGASQEDLVACAGRAGFSPKRDGEQSVESVEKIWSWFILLKWSEMIMEYDLWNIHDDILLIFCHMDMDHEWSENVSSNITDDTLSMHMIHDHGVPWECTGTCDKIDVDKIKHLNGIWLVVSSPLWKIWVRQLGWLYIPNISGKMVSKWQPVTTNQGSGWEIWWLGSHRTSETSVQRHSGNLKITEDWILWISMGLSHGSQLIAPSFSYRKRLKKRFRATPHLLVKGGVPKSWGTQELLVYHGKSHWNGWFRATPILGNPNLS